MYRLLFLVIIVSLFGMGCGKDGAEPITTQPPLEVDPDSSGAEDQSPAPEMLGFDEETSQEPTIGPNSESLSLEPAAYYPPRSTSYVFGDRVNTYVNRPAPATSRSLDFIHRVSYLPDHDDDYNWSVLPTSTPGRYHVVTSQGRSTSRLKFTAETWDIPSYMGWKRKYIVLTDNKDYDVVKLDVPFGDFAAVTLIEVLQYWPGGDDDLAYAVRAFAVGRSMVVHALNDFGRDGSSQIILRVTVLYWYKGHNLPVNVARVASTMSGGNSAYKCGRVLAVPTFYMTDTSKYKYDGFNSPLKNYYSTSQAGKTVSVIGVIQDARSVGTAIASMDFATIAVTVGSQLYKWLTFGLGPDDRDDDFYSNLSKSGCSYGVNVGHGNVYSLAEMTVWQLGF